MIAAASVLLLLLLQGVPSLPSATRQSDKCTIEGSVLSTGANEPLKKAVVVLRKAEGQDAGEAVMTDASGHFEFKGIEPGRYHLTATRNGYVRQPYGQKGPRSAGAILTLTPGQDLRDIVFKMIPAAAISGHVYDEDGDPVARAQVRALGRYYMKGQRTLAPQGFAQTDDRGEYRLFGLAPGEYYLSADYKPELAGEPVPEGMGHATSYYPGTVDMSRAVPLQVQAGDDLPGVDFTLQSGRTYNIRGQVYDAINARPAANAMVLLMPRNRDVIFMTPVSTFVNNSRGSFEMKGVSPGSYELTVSIEAGGRRRVAREPVDVINSDVTGLLITVGPGITLPGRLRVEGSSSLDLQSLHVMLWPREQGIFIDLPSVSAKADGSFVFNGVGDGDYRLRVSELPPECYLKSARLAGEDILADGLTVRHQQPSGTLDVVISTAGGQVEGVVLHEQQPFSGATVVLVPDAPGRDRSDLYESSSTDQYGRFVLQGISPGDYKLFAWDKVEGGAYQNAEFLQRYEDRGKAVRVDEGGHLNEQLELIVTSEPQ